MEKYFLFENVPDNSPLADRLNKIMGKLFLLRARTMPITFEFNNDTAEWFYRTCVFEGWCHDVVRKLHLWKELTDFYLEACEGQAENFAIHNRMTHIEDYGEGEDGDYDSEGNAVIKRELTDEELAKYSVIADMYNEKGIVETTTCNKFAWLCIALQEGAKSVNEDIEKFADHESDFYKKFADMTVEEKDLERAVAMANADDDFLFVVVLCYKVITICTTLRFLDKTQNNVEELRKINKKAGNLLNNIFLERKAESEKTV